MAFLVYYQTFKNKTILQQINVQKRPSSIRRRDSNSQPSAYEYPHLTTRSGLPSKYSPRFQLYNLALKGFTPLLLSTAFRYAEANFDLEEQNLF